MKSIYISIATVFAISFSAKSQGGVSPNVLGLSYGYRIHDLVYKQPYYNDTTNISGTAHYLALHFKQYSRLGDIGPFNAGLSYAIDFGAIRFASKAYHWTDDIEAKKDKGGAILNLSLLGEMYFGEDDEASFFLGLGGSLSLTTEQNLGYLYVGPKMLIGQQFWIDNLLFSVSGNLMYGINKNDLFGDYKGTILLEKKKCQFGLTLAWVMDA